jgi:hypothetical protein
MCPADEGAIVLDLQKERYFGVPQREVPAVTKAVLAAQADLPIPLRHVDPTALLSIPHEARRELSRAHLLRLMATACRVGLAFKLYGGKAPIRRLMRIKRGREPSRAEFTVRDLASISAEFRAFRPWLYTARDRCLFASLVLASYLQELGFDPTFVIGVRTKPFSAHAWVQVGNYVVDDSPEMVGSFTPILAI